MSDINSFGNILVLEDDITFNETLCDFLEDEGYRVVGVLDPKSALQECYGNRFDLYILDINLPFESGLKFLSSLRESGDDTPAIFLTSREDRESLISGLKIGADDYLKKPIDLEELSLRIRSILRRNRGVAKFEIDGFVIDRNQNRVYRGDEEIDIEKKPFELLVLLLQAKGEIVTIEQISSKLWSASEESSYGAIRVYITRLKKIFGDRIENIRGVGYRFII